MNWVIYEINGLIHEIHNMVWVRFGCGLISGPYIICNNLTGATHRQNKTDHPPHTRNI